MCGILASFSKTRDINRDLFKKSLDTLSCRGPDDSGIEFFGKAALGQRRLSIVDLSILGRQPMSNEDKSIWITFNGEIYNYLELKNKLKESHNFTSRTDTEVLIHAYEEFGESLVDHIQGMFAFILYDTSMNQVFIARDHFGKKPIYYYLDQEVFLIGSEIKSLITHPSVAQTKQIDESSLQKFMIYGYIPSPNSIYKNIKKLEASSFMVFDLNKWEITKKNSFWSLAKTSNNQYIHENTALATIDELLTKSVQKRLMGDVPVGLFLSGGIDSSLMAVYLQKLNANLQAYSVIYQDKNADESKYSEYVAKKTNLIYKPFVFEDKDVLRNTIEIFDYLDEPLADAAIIPLYFISKQAKGNIKVVLSGDGGDEIFAGYPKYQAQIFIQKYYKILKIIKYLTYWSKDFIRADLLKLLTNIENTPYQNNFIFGSGSFELFELDNLLIKSPDIDKIFEEASKLYEEASQLDNLHRLQFLDTKLQLPDWYLVKGDQATMANSIEMRNPLLDKDLAEYSFTIPKELVMKNGISKYILKNLARKYFDDNFVDRPKKGFGVPLDIWIRTELKELFYEYIHKDNDLINSDYSKQLLEEHISSKRDNRFKLLRIFAFNYWYHNKYVKA